MIEEKNIGEGVEFTEPLRVFRSKFHPKILIIVFHRLVWCMLCIRSMNNPDGIQIHWFMIHHKKSLVHFKLFEKPGAHQYEPDIVRRLVPEQDKWNYRSYDTSKTYDTYPAPLIQSGFCRLFIRHKYYAFFVPEICTYTILIFNDELRDSAAGFLACGSERFRALPSSK